MATLETQYKNYMKIHPESKFTFDEWKEAWSKELKEALTELQEKQKKL
jgi:hypothetical protein